MFTVPDMIRLADGDVPNAGRLEIYHDNLWGSVCRDNFNNTAGTVACQQLGYARLQEYYWGNQTVQGTGNIWLDDISCSSSHVRLSQCNSRGWGVTDCRHNDDISLVCEGKRFHNNMLWFLQAIQIVCRNSVDNHMGW